MRRRDFTVGLLLAAASRSAQAEEGAKQHRIAIVIPAGAVALIGDTGLRHWQAFFSELRRLGDLEGQSLTVERYSGEGRPEGFGDLAREAVARNPDLIVAQTNSIALAVRAATGTIPIVWIGVNAIGLGLVTNLARPGGNITGVSLYDAEIYAKRLQLLKEAVPSASKVAFLTPRRVWEGAYGQEFQPAYQEANRRLQISLIPMLLQQSAPSEYHRVFAEIAEQLPDAIIVADISDLFPYRQLIVELIEKSRLPAIYGDREYVEAGGLMAYGVDPGEAWRRMADDVHEILNGASPGDIPIYQAAKFEFVINLKTAQALGLTIPPTLLARADEVIE